MESKETGLNQYFYLFQNPIVNCSMNLYDFASNSEPPEKETVYYLTPKPKTEQTQLSNFTIE